MVIEESMEKKVISLWLFQILDPREIEDKIGVPKTTGYRIINDFRKEIPDIGDFREIWKSCKKTTNLSPVDIIRLFNLLARFNELGTSFRTLIGAAEIFNKQGEKADTAISSALVFQDRAEKSGRSYQDVVIEENQLRDRDEALRAEVSKLQAEKERLDLELLNLRELRELRNKLDEQKIDAGKLDGFIDDHVEYSRNGFTREAAKVIASEFGKLGLSPIAGGQKIAEIVSKYGSLQKSNALFFQMEDRHEEKLREQRDEIAKLDKAIADKQRFYLERSTNLEGEFGKKKLDLDDEITKLVESRDTLQSGIDELNKKSSDVEIKLTEKQDRISVVDTVYSFLANPLTSPREKLAVIANWVNSAYAEWGAGRTGNADLKFAHNSLVGILVDIVGADLCRKSDYDALNAEFEKCRKDNSEFAKLLPEVKEKFDELDVANKGNEVRDSVVHDISVLGTIRSEEEGTSVSKDISKHFAKEYPEGPAPPSVPISDTVANPSRMHSLKCIVCDGYVSLDKKGVLSARVSYFCEKCDAWVMDSLESLYLRELQYRMRL